MTRWLMGLCSTQAKVEGIMPKAVWQWGGDSSVINDPLGEQGCTPLYVGLLYACDSVDSDHVFPTFHEGLLFWDSDKYIQMNKPLALEMEQLSIHRDPVGERRWRFPYCGL
jgi:hypothetical protein